VAKVKTTFFCQNCGAQSGKWIGNCPSCGEWNTYVEEIIQRDADKKTPGIAAASKKISKPQLVSEINLGEEQRINIQDKELARVLGGGLVPF
jgi:DNA repair protein RadA/Sms